MQREVIGEPIIYANQAQLNPSTENRLVLFSNPVPRRLANARLGPIP